MVQNILPFSRFLNEGRCIGTGLGIRDVKNPHLGELKFSHTATENCSRSM